MATRTIVKETRSLDHIYDPVHTTSAPADHNKLTARALAVQFEKVPEAAHYFSELKNYPSATLRPGKARDSFLPRYVDPNWAPRLDPDANATHVFGSERFKYDKRPLVKMGAFNPGTGPQLVMYDIQKGGMMSKQGTMRGNMTMGTVMHHGATRTVGTQSMYRESEAQTTPYTPDFVAQDNPEVLTLRNLTYDNGLPASLFEVKIIERTRQKRLFEQMLPPATDEFSLNVRAQLLEQQEFKEWAERERQIIRLQERRLELVKQLLAEREVKRQSRNEAKVERLRVKKAEEKDRLFAGTQYRKIKLLRKMYTAMARNQRPEHIGETVARYQDKGSTTYAPLMRNGHKPDSNTAKIEIQPSDLKSYSKLLQLERTMPASVLLPPDVHQEALISETKRQDLPVVAALNEAMAQISAQSPDIHLGETVYNKSAIDSTAKSPKRKAKETAVIEEAPPEDEEKAQAILLLQRVLRGRAIQNRMFEGKEKRLDLIEELRASEQLMQSAGEEDKAAVEKLQQQILAEEEQDTFVGSVVSKALDDLSKELERVQEMRRIDAMMKLAERERRMRQAAEGGRRQAEERLRAREDEVFRQVMKDAHQGTVDTYLEEILTSCVEASAKERALAEAKAQAERINSVVDGLEKAGDDEGCVKELVESLVIPHAERELLQRRITIESKRFIDAARGALDSTLGEVENTLREDGSIQ
ncbi:unnamed protein product [Amoebophrya sp. A120]|nr:unnamed protein product [Amoebophrya sp. A120]|eukprot:GSA120T00008260001.1